MPTRPGDNRTHWPAALFSDPVSTESRDAAILRTAQGEQLPVNWRRWHAVPTLEEGEVLERATGTVLDVGCGPGRHVLALVAAGRAALGIDVSPAAVATAQRRGAPAMQVSVFGAVPGAGAWDTALLLDGNIGIGGDPQMLLSRLARLLAPAGHVLVEMERPEVRSRRLRVRVEHGGGRTGWFPWATVAVPELRRLAAASGFEECEVWLANGRWFANLRRPAVRQACA